MYWWNYSPLEKVALRDKPIWVDPDGVYSPQVLTFYYTNPLDLIIYKNQLTPSSLQFTFLDDYFIIYHVKVYFSNGCYVQYWR